jgi:hypothetical protein
MTNQAISGLTPTETREATVMVVWPSVALYASGRWLGRWYSDGRGFYIFRLGNLIALATSPWAFVLYFYRVSQGICYRLTNRRLVVLRFRREVKSIALDGFDTIDVERLPGQQWYDAGDLVFRLGGTEQFRLEAVSRPEAFRLTCLKSHAAFVGVKQAQSREPVPA